MERSLVISEMHWRRDVWNWNRLRLQCIVALRFVISYFLFYLTDCIKLLIFYAINCWCQMNFAFCYFCTCIMYHADALVIWMTKCQCKLFCIVYILLRLFVCSRLFVDTESSEIKWEKHLLWSPKFTSLLIPTSTSTLYLYQLFLPPHLGKTNRQATPKGPHVLLSLLDLRRST